MARFPVDVPRERVFKALERLGFQLVREGNHIAMIRENPDGTRTPLTMPNQRRIKGSTLRTILWSTLGTGYADFSRSSASGGTSYNPAVMCLFRKAPLLLEPGV